MKAKNNTALPAGRAKVVYICEESWHNVPNGLATDGKRWFTYFTSTADCRNNTVAVSEESTEVSLSEACRWFEKTNEFSHGGGGSIGALLLAVVKELERLGSK